MKFYCLASGSKGNAFLLEENDTRILIDCGSTRKYLTHSFHTLDIDYTRIDALLITHQHSDHISQVKMFDSCKLYSASYVKDHIDQKYLVPYEKIQIESLSITTIPLSHDAEKTVGFVIENGQEKLIYMTDTGYVNENNFDYLRNADYYIVESNHDVKMLMQSNRPHYIKSRILSDSGHLCNEDSASFMRKMVSKRTKEIVLAHLSQEANDPDLAVSVMKEALSTCTQELNPNLRIAATKQFEILEGGWLNDEETGDNLSCGNIGMECLLDNGIFKS